MLKEMKFKIRIKLMMLINSQITNNKFQIFQNNIHNQIWSILFKIRVIMRVIRQAVYRPGTLRIILPVKLRKTYFFNHQIFKELCLLKCFKPIRNLENVYKLRSRSQKFWCRVKNRVVLWLQQKDLIVLEIFSSEWLWNHSLQVSRSENNRKRRISIQKVWEGAMDSTDTS